MNTFDLDRIDRETGYKSIIESLLFVWAEPLSLSKIASVLDVRPSVAENLLSEMMATYEEEKRGIQIVETDKHYRFATRRENYEAIEKLCGSTRSRGLSNSALEVLAIVAYKQPITKYEIEQIRGVNSDGPIQSLMERELVEIKGKLDRAGRPQIYGTTHRFLANFGFKDLDELPSMASFSQALEAFNKKEDLR
ncbi:MAG: segregation and condensation protein [Clostridiales bacterium]|jgi:segregation and condensation protein B|nr:segregation and condensation protein [Clostridiales bacterium]